MACERKRTRKTKTARNEKYLNDLYKMLKQTECLSFSDSTRYFSNTELRLITEILAAKYEGRRLISTQLADLLGVTRSAISQIVSRLESEGLVCRVADAVDRKIAYIEVTEKTLATYDKDIASCNAFVGKVVDIYGEEKFEQMLSLFTEFTTLVEDEKAKCKRKKKKLR